jgi:hypothetical protein
MRTYIIGQEDNSDVFGFQKAVLQAENRRRRIF